MKTSLDKEEKGAGPADRKSGGPGSALSRRRFLAGSAAMIAMGMAGIPPVRSGPGVPRREASFCSGPGGGAVQCLLCPHSCTIPPGGRGKCGVRENVDGSLYSLVYGRPCSMHLDPIEKKPFFHVMPGTSAFSLSTVGCNMTCRFCQNWQISRAKPEDIEAGYAGPDEIVERALSVSAGSIAFTYGEPVVFFEYMYDIACAAREKGLRSLVVTNGYCSIEAIKKLCGRVDAVKIDLKAFDDAYYKRICGGSLKPVLDSLVEVRKAGVWLEIVYLVVPTLNDGRGEIGAMSRWIISELGPDVPVHFSRFFPQYRLTNLPPTPVSSLEAARKICIGEGARYVYIGNAALAEAESTYCHACGRMIISRKGHMVTGTEMSGGKCNHCGAVIPGIWREGKG
ncbi:MAG: AmmeMemoRadiSam system radical SAM enzyme [Candidatus Krumholzibacteria bacterium]|nr:AmmeMemoRadiSam system radical SAM enzyme [Candidatus Krumholzibacteria bacterium]